MNRDDISKGFRWIGGGRLVSQLFELVFVTIILMKLLEPSDFGIVGAISIVTSFLFLLADFGLESALIQKDDGSATHFASVFALGIATAVLISAAFALGATFVVDYYNRPELLSVAHVMSVIFLLRPLESIQVAWLTKQLKFDALAIGSILSSLISGAVAVLLAWNGFGVWALVAKIVIRSSTTILVLWIMSDWRPSFDIDKSAIRDLLKYGGNLTGFSIVNFWARRIDDFLVAHFFGSEALGLYDRSYEIMMLPIREVNGVAGRVMFPILSKLSDDLKRFADLYCDALAGIATVSFPLMTGLYLISEDFVPALLGEKWLPMVPILNIFCLVGAVQSIGTTVGWIYMATGRTDTMFRFGIVGSVVQTSFIVYGAFQGSALAIAQYYTVGVFVFLVPQFWIPARIINMSPLRVVQALVAPTLVTAMAAGATLTATTFGAMRFELVAALFLAVYLCGSLISRHRGVRFIRSIVTRDKSNPNAA